MSMPLPRKSLPAILNSSPAIMSAAHRALAAREQVLRDYPQWPEWRLQAREVRAAALSRLEELLERLTESVTSLGGTVLKARDGQEARRLVLEVARRHRVKSVVKSKSMTAEEIGLRPALSAAGLGVTETDLGEFIIQLAGDSPAHLTAPALHLNRGRIAELFREHLGEEVSPDPVALSRLAARHLKPRFAAADLGITGVNWAAPDGTLVLVENEGNLRLTAARPRVHLAVMGLEKMVADLADAEVLLRLLPPSATGQRLTALVHFLRGPQPHPQGRRDFYLVLLDNGRSRLAADPELRPALFCLRCGACLNVCPVFQAGAAHLYGRVYPGAIGILLAPYLDPVGDLSELCTQCGACEDLCPVALELPALIRGQRRLSPRFRGLRVLSRAAGQVLSRPLLYRWLEPGLRLAAPLVPALKARVARESFHRRRRRAAARKAKE
jgi:L-lactate dehydrogenase complex protein LldF